MGLCNFTGDHAAQRESHQSEMFSVVYAFCHSLGIIAKRFVGLRWNPVEMDDLIAGGYHDMLEHPAIRSQPTDEKQLHPQKLKKKRARIEIQPRCKIQY